MILQSLIVLLAVVIGYYLGAKRSPLEDVQTLVEGLPTPREVVAPLLEKPVDPGVIKRPTAQELWKKNEDAKMREAKEAVKETLDQVPELQEAKARVAQLKQHGKL